MSRSDSQVATQHSEAAAAALALRGSSGQTAVGGCEPEREEYKQAVAAQGCLVRCNSGLQACCEPEQCCPLRRQHSGLDARCVTRCNPSPPNCRSSWPSTAATPRGNREQASDAVDTEDDNDSFVLSRSARRDASEQSSRTRNCFEQQGSLISPFDPMKKRCAWRGWRSA